MNANGFVVAGIIAAGFCACAQIQARVGDHLPDGKFIDSVDAEAFSYGTVSVGKQRDVDLQRSVGLGLAHAPELESYVQSVVDRLLVQSPMTGIPVDVHIRASEEFGAMATADANIFVDVGLIRKVKSEDQLAFALGHELSHIILGHTDTDIVAKTQRQAAMLTELSVAVGGQVRSMRGKQGPGGMLDDSKLEE